MTPSQSYMFFNLLKHLNSYLVYKWCGRGPWSWKNRRYSLDTYADDGGEDQREYELMVDGIKLAHCVTDLGRLKYV